MRTLVVVAVLVACKSSEPPPSLVASRAGFHSKLVEAKGEREAPEPPPAGVMSLVKYDAAPGKLSAYLSPDPGDGKKHPAIVWITGGDCNSIGDVWSPAEPANDQSASQYRAAGLVMLYPSLRGGNDNPGRKEGFLGEVDDVLAATDFLAKQPYVDPQHIYLGGHSTGGTLALLVAEVAPAGRYAGVFSFGAVDHVDAYAGDTELLPFDTKDAKEVSLRSPIEWLDAIQTPTFVLEGYGASDGPSNIAAIWEMEKASHNSRVTFIEVSSSNHFAVLAPVNKLIAGKLAAGTVALTADEANAATRRASGR